MEEAIRLNKYLSDAGICSRREADRLIEAGKVLVDGQTASMGMKVAPGQTVVCDGKTVGGKDKPVFLAVNKPRGIVCTTSDKDQAENIVEFLNYPQRIYPVGRLDKDREGLLLLTNDGEFANLLTHPSHGVTKLYRVTVHPHATEEQLIALTDGVVLDDGTKTQPVVIRVVADEPERTVMEMTLSEGKNRQIRRMCEAVGLDVARLRRTAVGPVKLGMLAPGQFRELDKQEVRALRAMAQKGKAAAQIEKNTRRRAARTAHGPRAPKGAVKRGNRL